MEPKLKQELSPKQFEALKTIKECITRSGFSPTFSELRKELGVKSDNSVIKVLNILENKGFIERKREQIRSIRLTAKANIILTLPSKDVREEFKRSLEQLWQYIPSDRLPSNLQEITKTLTTILSEIRNY